ncbi:TIGR03751 family conjugal transfer lipoprotein [Vibrio sp. 10N.261.46.A3]|uniref:TIGR03751 family conjugal transfer lipoprotein n=1 Tax=Vibrio sp. 10N.261.46.A3 TaxID=3229658 RepID=UPI0035539C11
MRCLKHAALVAIFLSGCTTNQEAVLPQPDTNVKQVWNEEMGAGRSADASPSSIQRERALDASALARKQSDYARDSYREHQQLFQRLPNPDIVLYVMPHRAGQLPVPGYTTVFPLYERAHYKM